jgi:hypothetical protein
MKFQWTKILLAGVVFGGGFVVKWFTSGLGLIFLGVWSLSTFDLVPLELYRQGFHRIPSLPLFIVMATLLHFVTGFCLGACFLSLYRGKSITRGAYLLWLLLIVAVFHAVAACLFPAPGLLCWDCS